MAQRGDQLDSEKYCCSICLHLLKDPVTIPCGHSYCRNCIKSHWDRWDQKKIYNCPYCEHNCKQRPVLMKNTMLADLMEELKSTGLQAAPADHCCAGPGDVSCDFCTGRKRKATKSCLQCLVSCCEQHLQPHYKVVPLKKHKLVEAANLQENICSRHNEVMKIFCRTDQQCICYLCSMDEHKVHDTVSAAAEITKSQGEIGPRRQNIQQRIQDREKHVMMLQQEVEAINRSADKAVEDSEKMCRELVCLIEKRSSDVTCKIRSQQEIEVNRAKDLQRKLEQELVKLRKRDAALEKLSDTEDQIKFLDIYSSLSRPVKSTVFPKINSHPLQYFEDVTAAVSEATGKLKNSYINEWNKISMTVTEADVLLPQDPKTKAELSQYVAHKNPFKLHPNTANMRMLLSEENRKATTVNVIQFHPTHSDRFIDMPQALSTTCLTGRCYWEVQWSGLGVSVAVAYQNIARIGKESIFGNNDKSWVLECVAKGNYNFKHGSNKKVIPGPESSRVGVFLDHRAGILSFYSISETITLLHTVQTTFTQPLYAGLGVYFFGSTAEFCQVDKS